MTIPAGSVTGSGRLTVTPVADGPAPGAAKSWSVELTGAKLTGNAMLAFPVESGKPDPVVGFVDAKGFHAVKTVRTGDTVVVTTPHFSLWSTFSWDAIAATGRQLLDRVYAQGAQGKQPSCAGQDQLAGRGVKVTSSSGQRVMWCAGTRSSGTFLKVVNTRGYMMRLEYTPGLKLKHASTASILAPALAGAVEKPSVRANSVVIIGAGEELEFDVTATGDVGVALAPSPAAMLVTAAVYAADTLGELAKFLKVEVGTLLTGAEAIGCIEGAVKHFTGSPANAVEMNEYLINAIETSFSCFEKTMAKQMGFLGGMLVSGFTWVLSGITTAANSLGAAADTLFNPASYKVVITTKAAAPAPTPSGTNWDVASWRIGWGYVGPFKVGMEARSAVSKGLVELGSGECGFKWRHTDRVQRLLGQGLFDEWRFGTSPDKLDVVATVDKRMTTDRGIHVGSTRAQVLAAYKGTKSYQAPYSAYKDDLVLFGPSGYALLFDFDSTSSSAPVILITASRGTNLTDLEAFVGEC